jgi:hypothetical protein
LPTMCSFTSCRRRSASRSGSNDSTR